MKPAHLTYRPDAAESVKEWLGLECVVSEYVADGRGVVRVETLIGGQQHGLEMYRQGESVTEDAQLVAKALVISMLRSIGKHPSLAAAADHVGWNRPGFQDYLRRINVGEGAPLGMNGPRIVE